MRCDHYAECSAVTGELMNIARPAARTTTESGGLTQGGCTIMIDPSFRQASALCYTS